MAHYSISIDLDNRKCVVIGGGMVAERKVETFLEFGAAVAVVSPELTPRLRELVDQGKIEYAAEAYQPGHLEGAFLAVAATDDRDINTAVFAEAQQSGILINVVDVPELCTFYMPATVRRGDLVISVSTSGRSPAMARRIREEIESRFGEEYGELAEILGDMRDEIKARYPDIADRNRAYVRILDSDALSLLAIGRKEEAVKRAHECIL